MGSLLYFYYQNFHTPPMLVSKQSIVITTTEIKDINQTRSKRLIIDATYFDKILLFEALSLELEKKDREIRIKLITQMRQILTPSFSEPSEELLHSYYQEHVDDYSITTQISFAHIYLQDIAEIDIKSFVEMLNLKAIEPQDAIDYGNKFTLGNQMSSLTQSQLAQRFGKYFAGQAWRLRSQKWHGVIRSQYGYHILFITNKQSGELLLFDEVEDRVYMDYMQEQKDSALQSAYEKLVTKYRLERR